MDMKFNNSQSKKVITSLISIIILIVGFFLLLLAEILMRPESPIYLIVLQDFGLALLVAAIPYLIFKLIDVKIEKPIEPVIYRGNKKEAGEYLDSIIIMARIKIDILGLSLKDFF